MESTVSQRQKAVLKLTPRQREVLQLVAEGRSAREIGTLLKISARTVEYHKYRLMEDLKLRSSAELIRYAIKHGIVSD
ncbi:MAG: response regulator transcription factor [candidate division NC10 bacterium]|nr:response regulator transcription factor [candidate division NC10 bacterium]